MFGLTDLYTKLLGAGIVVAALAGVYFYGHHAGYVERDKEAVAERAKALDEYQTEMLDEIDRSNKVASDFEDWKAAHRVRSHSYAAPAAAFGICPNPPADFVSLLNDAAAGAEASMPASSGQSACAPGAVGLDQVAAVTTQNYTRCNEYIGQLNRLITYIKDRQ